jgi:hypothetical protein
MKAQAVTTSAIAPEPFHTLILSSRQAKFEDKASRHVEDKGSRKVSGGTRTLSGAVIRSAEDAAEAQSDQPAMADLDPMLGLLKMLRSRSPRHHRPRWQGPTA